MPLHSAFHLRNWLAVCPDQATPETLHPPATPHDPDHAPRTRLRSHPPCRPHTQSLHSPPDTSRSAPPTEFRSRRLVATTLRFASEQGQLPRSHPADGAPWPVPPPPAPS